MNVNLTSATESSKITKGVTDKTTASDEATEAEGFFAKLTAMLKGESKSELKSVDSASGKAAEQVSSKDAEVLEGGKAQSTDALLSGADAELEGEASELDASSELAAKESQESAVAVPKELEKFIENSDELESSSQQVKQTVAESEALLGRLEQANKTLQAKDGNTLPPQDADLASETAALDEKSSLSDDVMVAQTAHSTDGEALQAVAAQAPTSEQPINAESLPNQTAKGVQTGQINSAALAPSEQAPTMSEAELAAAHASQANVMSGAKTTSQDTDEVGLTSSMTEQQGELTVSGDGEVIAPAIAWSSNGAVATDDISKQMVETDLLHKQTHKTVTNAAQLQAGVAATVTNGATNSQVANPAALGTPASALTPATPMDLSAAAQLQANAAPAVKPEQMMLQSALGAKAAATIGKLATPGENSNGSEASFAQQLGQAAGQNGVTAQMRAEQAAQAQPALQLSREMAGEQVAERIQMMLSKNLKNIDIRLDPPELGRMQIRMNMNGDNATVHFTVANQQARDIVEQAMPRLREMLAQQGMQLGDSSVQQQASGQQQGRYATGNDSGTGQGSSGQHLSGEENLEPDVKLDLNVAAKRDGISYYA